MTVPIAVHQFLIEGKQDDADLQARRQRNERDGFSGLNPPGFEFFDESHGVRRRCGIAVAIDGDHRVVPGAFAERCGDRSHSLAYRSGGRLMRDHVIDVLYRNACGVEYFVSWTLTPLLCRG